MKEWEDIRKALAHKPFNAQSETYRSAVHPMSPNLQMECRYRGLGKSIENRMSGHHPD